MNKSHLLATIALIAGAFTTAKAQIAKDAVVTIGIDNKVILVDKLNLPESTPVMDVLTILPELVNRKSEYMINDYDIQINDMSAGEARDAMLNQLRIADIQKIEVSENSLSSVTSFGQGGSINIILKDVSKKTSGNVNLDAAWAPDIDAGAIVNHKTGKWLIRGLANAEYYKPGSMTSKEVIFDETAQTSDMKQRFLSQTARIYSTCNLSANDILKLNFSQILMRDRTDNDCESFEEGTDRKYSNLSISNNLHLYALAEYLHTFRNKSKVTTQFNYMYAPQTDSVTTVSADYGPMNEMFRYNMNVHNIFGKVEYVHPLITNTGTKSLDLEMGFHATYRISDNNAVCNRYESPHQGLLTDESNCFLRPYLKLSGTFGPFSFMGTADLQNYHYILTYDLQHARYHTQQNDVTGMAVARWNIDQRNSLRFTYMRTLVRPSGEQLFPYEFVDKGFSDTKGNPYLKSMKSDNIDLDYILDMSSDDYKLTFNLGVDYSHAYDVIRSMPDASGVASYTNRGTVNAVRGNLMGYFSKGIFSLSLTANVYHGDEDLYVAEEYDDNIHHTHFNLSLTPSINFATGYAASVAVFYNSKVVTQYLETGTQCYTHIRVGKTWTHWNVHLYCNIGLGDKRKDVVKYNEKTVTTTQFMKDEFGFGARYLF